MQISQRSAQQIVDEIGRLVRQHINMMDETGHIIASTDPLRIGQFHNGAYRIITQHLPELYITPEAATATVRCGLNLPVEAHGDIVGVIGITGPYEEVIDYGQIVKKMTEILIRERSALDQQRLDLRVRSRFLEDWILGEGLTNAQNLAERGLALGIDITLPRRVLVVSVRDREHYTDTTEGQQLIEAVENTVSDCVRGYPGSMILRNAARQILILRRRPTQELRRLAAGLAAAVEQVHGVPLVVGIDGEALDLHMAYLQASRAWHTASHRPGRIIGYEELNIELFLNDMPRHSKEEYLRKLFPDLEKEALCGWMRVLEAYFAAEGSLSAAADALFVHKNTLQYRLKSLAALTGLDVRRPSQAPALYMALLCFQDLEWDPPFMDRVHKTSL